MRQLEGNLESYATAPSAAERPRAVRTKNVGAALRRAREARGLALNDVERALRIREPHLRALEANRFDELPGTAYARLFTREYAEYVGLDGDRVLALAGDRLTEHDQIEDTDEPSATESGVAPSRVLVWIDRAFGRIPTRVRRWAWLVGVLVPLLIVIVRADGRSQPTTFEPSTGTQTGVATRPHALAVAQTPPDSRQIAAPATPIQARVSVPRTARVELAAARGDCWLLVRERSSSGSVVFEGILRKGGAVEFQGRALWLRVGAPWNLAVHVNGRAQRGLPTKPSDLLITSRGVKTTT
jgi:Helix-turn-helix domain/RodZ C-terminal domain